MRSKPQLIVKKAQLDQDIAIALGRKRSLVSAITQELLRIVTETLVNGDVVRLDGLGELELSVRESRKMTRTVLTHRLGNGGGSEKGLMQVDRKYYVSFRQSGTFKRAIREKHPPAARKVDAMNKYAVDENVDQESLEKQASNGCPNCGKKVERHGNVLACPNCGTEPFEQKK